MLPFGICSGIRNCPWQHGNLWRKPPLLAVVSSCPQYAIKKAPLTGEVVEVMRQVPRESVPDMPDRIVAATAMYLGVPVISRDGRIRAFSIQTIW